MTDIFLSYAREDLATAKRVARALEGAGLSVWWDRRLLVGQQFSSEIEQAIDAARSVVVLWSEKASHSRWVRDEASAGADQGKLCPVLIDSGQVPLGFRQFHTIDLKDWDGGSERPAFRALVEQLLAHGAAPEIEHSRKRAGEPVLAVLPFDNLSSDEEMRYFSDGISDEILVRLMRGSKIKLIGRATSFQYRDERKAAAAKELDCTHLLDGSVRRSGNRVRTTVHLLDIASERSIWSNRFDDRLEDILDTQERIAEAIAQALDSEFSVANRREIPPEIYDRYLQVKTEVWGVDEVLTAIAALEEITRNAPEFPDAWGRLAILYGYISITLQGSARDELHRKLLVAVRNCIRLDPNNVDALAAEFRALPALGHFLERYPVTARLAEVGSNSSFGNFILAIQQAEVGRLKVALEHAKLARSLDPRAPSTSLMEGIYRAQNGQFQKGIDMMVGDLAEQPGNFYISLSLASAAIAARNWEVLDELLAAPRLARYPIPGFSHVIAAMKALRSGNSSDASDAVSQIEDRASSMGRNDILSLVWLAELKESDAAYNLLDRYSIGLPDDPKHNLDHAHFLCTSLFVKGFSTLREDARFPVLAARVGLAQYWLETDEWPDCADRLDALYGFRTKCREAARSVEIDRFLPE